MIVIFGFLDIDHVMQYQTSRFELILDDLKTSHNAMTQFESMLVRNYNFKLPQDLPFDVVIVGGRADVAQMYMKDHDLAWSIDIRIVLKSYQTSDGGCMLSCRKDVHFQTGKFI